VATATRWAAQHLLCERVMRCRKGNRSATPEEWSERRFRPS
jgi:hypothetical protein